MPFWCRYEISPVICSLLVRAAMRLSTGSSGLVPSSSNARLIHAAFVVVADLLINPGAAGVRFRGGFQNAAEDFQVAVCQNVEPPPAGLIGGNRVVLHPQPAGILVEIVAGTDAFVDESWVETGELSGSRLGRKKGRKGRQQGKAANLRHVFRVQQRRRTAAFSHFQWPRRGPASREAMQRSSAGRHWRTPVNP